MERKWKFRYIVALAIIYVVSIILLLIGYFTPQWLTDTEEKQYYSYFSWPFIVQECSTVGLISGSCRYPYPQNTKESGDMGRMMISVFWMMLTALIIVAISAVMVTVTLVKNLEYNQVFMSFLSVLFGVFYPIAAVLVIVSSTIVAAKYTKEVGYSAIITSIAGGLMLIFYIGLLTYDVMYTSSRVKKQEKKELANQNSSQN